MCQLRFYYCFERLLSICQNNLVHSLWALATDDNFPSFNGRLTFKVESNNSAKLSILPFADASAGWDAQPDGSDPRFRYSFTLENTITGERKVIPFDMAVEEINKAHVVTEVLHLGGFYSLMWLQPISLLNINIFKQAKSDVDRIFIFVFLFTQEVAFL